MNTPESGRWLAYARSDLDAAHALLRDPEHYPRQVCFLAQQSAEKALKALLVSLDIEFPRTHDLDRLRESVPPGWRVKAEFPQLYALSIWAVESRYPGDLPEVVESDAQQALRLAERILQVIEQDFEIRTGSRPTSRTVV
jgi:HEPN domain-containing protein